MESYKNFDLISEQYSKRDSSIEIWEQGEFPEQNNLFRLTEDEMYFTGPYEAEPNSFFKVSLSQNFEIKEVHVKNDEGVDAVTGENQVISVRS